MAVKSMRSRVIGDRAIGVSLGTATAPVEFHVEESNEDTASVVEKSAPAEAVEEADEVVVEAAAQDVPIEPSEKVSKQEKLTRASSRKSDKPQKIRRSVYWSEDIEDRLVMFLADQRIQRKRKSLTTISAVLEAALDKFLPK